MKNINRRTKVRSGSVQEMLGGRQRSIAVITLALSIVLVLAASYGVMVLTESRSHSAAEKLVSQVVEHIDAKLDEVQDVTREASLTAYAKLDDPEALEQLVREFVSDNSFVYGSTVAFEPDIFPERGRCFAPYSWRTSDGTVHSRQLGTETDYYEEEWYAETKLTGEEYWCEPYFDEGGAKIMMCTFSVPLTGSDGKLRAVMTADVGLEDLEDYISTISPYPDSYIVLRSAKGSPLANGDRAAETGTGTINIKGVTAIGWVVELSMPLTSLIRGDTGILFYIGLIFLAAFLFVYIFNRLLTRFQQRSSNEYMSVIDAISSSFSSIYMVDLITNETVVFRDPGGYAKVLDEFGDKESTFTAKLSKLLEYDCYAPDRARMLWQVTPDAISRNLMAQDHYEVRFRKENNGEHRWFEMAVFVIEREKPGTPKRAVVAFTDVNDSVQKEKEAQDTLEKALDMAQAANKAKTEFLFNMSHDIRTPMNAIIGFTNMAKKHIDDREKVIDCLNKTQQSSGLLLTLINSVLDVSRIESGHAHIEESAADVQLSFTAIQDTMTELAAAGDISISFEIGEVRDRYVFADLARCNRIFVNIISNAIKYTHEGGRVTVRCDQLGSTREGWGNYRYTFTDNGIGMSEEFQKRVFDQFSREQTATVSGIQGSGLGLSVCKSFTELMGGTIECSSRLGEGTTFTVILPFRIQDGMKYVDPFTREEINATDVLSANSPVMLKGRRVLLVEDNELNLEIAEEILGDEGLVVETAGDGTDAVELMKNRGPVYYDFILMDIQMPVMNGYEATKAIRQMYPDAAIPIIAVSANAFEEDKRASREAGMDDHVAKPINVEELLTVLARFL